MNRFRSTRLALCAMLVLTLAACGGSGGGATFSVTASGSALSYQWARNGVAIAGASGSSYTTPSAGPADHGAQYSVTVSNARGSVTSNAATLGLVASSNQQIFERLVVIPGGGSHSARWNLNLTGGQTSGSNFLFSDHFEHPRSPLTEGPIVSRQSAPRNLAATLTLPTPGPTRVLKDGVILVVPATQATTRVSYQGGDVRVDSLAADGATEAYSQLRGNYTFTALTGLLASAPAELRQWLNSVFANPAVLDGATAWSAGAGYVTYTAASRGDRYTALDCGAATVDAGISPCATGTTLTAALAAGLTAADDGVTYRLADGSTRTVAGVPVWVAAAPRPLAATLTGTRQHRVYFQLGSNVYTGHLISDGTPIWGSYVVSNPNGATVEQRLTLLPYHVRLSKAAVDSLALASRL